MARIPTELDLGQRPIPSPQRGIYAPQNGQAAQAASYGAKVLGGIGERITGAANEANNAASNLQAAQAASMLYQARSAAQRAAEESNDPDLAEGIYQQQMSEALKQASSHIQDGNKRAMFVANAGEHINVGLGSVSSWARTRRRENAQASILQTNADNLQAALSDEDGFANYFALTRDVNKNAFLAGHLTAEQQYSMNKRWVDDYADNHFKGKIAEGKSSEVLRVLSENNKSGIAGAISGEKRLQFVKMAESELKQQSVKAMGLVKYVDQKLEDGSPVLPSEMQDAKNAAPIAGIDPQTLDYKDQTLQELRRMSPLDLGNEITRLESEARGKSTVNDTAGIMLDQPSPDGENIMAAAREKLDWAKKVQGQLQSAIKDGNILGWYANYAGGNVTPFIQETADGQNVAIDDKELFKRNVSFEETKSIYGKGAVLTQPEQEQISKLFDTMSPDNARNMVAKISSGLNPQAVKSLAESIAPKNPVLSAAMTADSPDISRRMILGSKYDYDLPAGLTAAIQEKLGAAITNDPHALKAAIKSVEALYRESAVRNNLGKIGITGDVLDQSIKEVTGGLITHNDKSMLPYRYGGDHVDTGGFTAVLKDVEKFGDAWVMDAIGAPYNDKGQQIPFRQLKNNFTWNSVGADKYGLRDAFGGTVYDKDGREYLIDMPTLHLRRDEENARRGNLK